MMAPCQEDGVERLAANRNLAIVESGAWGRCVVGYRFDAWFPGLLAVRAGHMSVLF